MNSSAFSSITEIINFFWILFLIKFCTELISAFLTRTSSTQQKNERKPIIFLEVKLIEKFGFEIEKSVEIVRANFLGYLQAEGYHDCLGLNN
jgi:hypothetical protein